jgi:hypothetical protein
MGRTHKTRPIEPFIEANPNVKTWLEKDFSDPATRDGYAWHLREVSEALNVKPDEFMELLKNTENNVLFGELKRHLIEVAKIKPRKAGNMRAAVTRYVRYWSNRPEKFNLAIPLKKKPKFDRPAWGLEEFRKILSYTNPRYRLLFTIAAMAGFGRKEIVYFNNHLDDVKPIPDMAEAVYLTMPARKSNDSLWKAVLPAKEVEELRRNGPVVTSWGTAIHKFNVPQQFKRATQRANIAVDGTASHVLRAIFRTVGGSVQPTIPEKWLEWSLGHFDKYHYDRSNERLKERAEALMPLWEHFRRGGPPTASRTEVEQLRKQLEDERQKHSMDLSKVLLAVEKTAKAFDELERRFKKLDKATKKVRKR